MALVTDTVAVSTRGDAQMLDITQEVQEVVERHGFREGAALVFVSGSTAGLTTVEYEPGLTQACWSSQPWSVTKKKLASHCP